MTIDNKLYCNDFCGYQRCVGMLCNVLGMLRNVFGMLCNVLGMLCNDLSMLGNILGQPQYAFARS